jgi:hypothetical protein
MLGDGIWVGGVVVGGVGVEVVKIEEK